MPYKRKTSRDFPAELLMFINAARQSPQTLQLETHGKAVNLRQEMYTLRKCLEEEGSPVAADLSNIVIKVKAIDEIGNPKGPSTLTAEPRFIEFSRLIRQQRPDLVAEAEQDRGPEPQPQPKAQQSSDSDNDPLKDYL